jgi:hypothetical protein
VVFLAGFRARAVFFGLVRRAVPRRFGFDAFGFLLRAPFDFVVFFLGISLRIVPPGAPAHNRTAPRVARYDPRMRRAVAIAVVVGSLHLAGCVALGWRFGPGFSSTDKELFAAPPVVVHRGQEFVLAWTQGKNPFFFELEYRVKDGRLVFALVATASSGNLAGRPREMKIDGDANIAALRRGGAYWWEPEPEPDGRLVPLHLVNQSSLPGP